MQKKIQYIKIIAILLMTISMIVVGCKKDDDPEKKEEVTYKGNAYKIDKAKVIEAGFSNFLLGLSSANADFDVVSDTLVPSGNGTLVIFQLIGNTSGDLVDGTYFFSATGANPMTIYRSWLFFDFDFVNGLGTQSYITSGKIILTLNESRAEIDIDTSTPSGDKVTGYYNGLLTFE